MVEKKAVAVVAGGVLSALAFLSMPGARSAVAASPDWAMNATAIAVVVQAYMCPSDPYIGQQNINSYHACSGTTSDWPTGPNNGIGSLQNADGNGSTGMFAVWLSYVVVVLALFLRPVKPSPVPAGSQTATPSTTTSAAEG